MAHVASYATRNADYADAIRSIAIEEMEGEDVAPRARHLANLMRIDIVAIRIDVVEMIDLLAD